MRLGIFGISAGAVKPYLAKGYTLIVAGIDTMLLGQAALPCCGRTVGRTWRGDEVNHSLVDADVWASLHLRGAAAPSQDW
jgi:hypothetical protein